MSWDQSQFDRTIRQYVQVSTRTLQQIVNTKAYFVARKAIWFTEKADASKIAHSLGQFVTANRINKRGRLVKQRKLSLAKSSRVDAPLAALIVNKRRGAKGVEGLYGRAMERAIRELLAARLKSRAFIKSGFLESVRSLKPFADLKGQPAVDSEAKQVGGTKGSATPAGPGFNPVATLENSAQARRDRSGALFRVGRKGLELALRDEERSMQEYIERKMKPDAERFNRQQN